jgi:hypothetical protein
MTENVCRGSMIHSTASHIEKAYDPATRKSIYDRVNPRVRELLASIERIDWYPVDDLAEIFRAIASHHRETDGKQLLALERVGRSIAETATTTSLRLLFRLMTPTLFAAKAASLWERNSRGCVLSVASYQRDKREMRVKLTGARGYDHIGAVAPGFILFALETMGCKDARVSFDPSDDSKARDEFLYDFAWS